VTPTVPPIRPPLGSTLRFLGALVGTSLRESFANRASFWIQAVGMFVNDVIWIAVWAIFFARFEHLAGWTLNDMVALYAVTAGAVGLAVITGAGVRDLARTIAEGGLDVFLVQPKPVLLHAVGSKTSAAGWGDLANCVLLLAVTGQWRLEAVPWVVVGAVAGAVVFLSIGVIVHSLAFWLGSMQVLARQVWEFTITFSLYPESIFPGALRLLLYTAIPAAFIGWFPSGLVRAFSLEGLAWCLAGAVVFPAVAAVVFHLGLRRYASGSRVEVRAG
jgi:ABC-2 type transport system permease protein